MIRPARLPEDAPAILSFIEALQAYEAAFESNRRRDAAFAAEHWAVLQGRLARAGGILLIAEEEGRAIGWALAHEEQGEVFVRAAERRHGILAELYVEPAQRGRGHGRALIAACEDWARGRGLALLAIAVLARNARAIRAYEGAGYAPYVLTLRKYL